MNWKKWKFVIISVLILVLFTWFLVKINGKDLHKGITDLATASTIIGFVISLILLKSVKSLSDALHTIKDNGIFHEDIIENFIKDLDLLLKQMDVEGTKRDKAKCQEIHENIRMSYSQYFLDLEDIPGTNKICSQFREYKSYLFKTKFHENPLDPKVIIGIKGKTASFKTQLGIYKKHAMPFENQILRRKADEIEE